MKIAIVSDDHKTISMHFGRAEFYEVYTIEAGKVTAHETLSRSFPLNPTAVVQPGQEAAHGHHHDHNAMIAPIVIAHQAPRFVPRFQYSPPRITEPAPPRKIVPVRAKNIRMYSV